MSAPNPSIDVPKDSKLPLTDVNKPVVNPEGEAVDIDDAQIQEPKDDAFKKTPQTQTPPLQERK